MLPDQAKNLMSVWDENKRSYLQFSAPEKYEDLIWQTAYMSLRKVLRGEARAPVLQVWEHGIQCRKMLISAMEEASK